MRNLIVFFIVIIAWLVYNILWFRKLKRKTGPSSNNVPKNMIPRKPPRGKQYAWTWMQAAGALQLKYIRPDAGNGYPAINGTRSGMTVMVQCSPSSEGISDSTVFRFQFPCPAELDLEMTFANDPSSPTEPADNRKSFPLEELFRGRRISPGVLQVRDPEILRSCLSSNCLDHLARLSLIYPVVRLTDSELLVRSNGINNDLTSFRSQLETLLEVASELKTFTERAAERKHLAVTVTESQFADADLTGRKQEHPETKPEPEQQPRPESAEEAKTEPEQQPRPEPGKGVQPEPVMAAETGSLEKNTFLRQLWSSGMNFQKQKDFFESCRGREVEWDGILKMSFPFSSDFVFGSGSGVKATFELAEFKPEGSFMPIRIKAVAAFSKDVSDLFAKASGKAFRFRGKLLKIEPIAREIYLSDGVITEAES